MTRFTSLLVLLLLCTIASAQDVYDIFGSDTCELLMDVRGVGNVYPMHVILSQDDSALATFDVADGEQSTQRLPVGALSYRVEVVTGEGDAGAYTISASLDCPANAIPEQFDYVTESPEDQDAWLLALYAQVPEEYRQAYTLEFLRQIAEGDPAYGYGPALAIQIVSLLNLDEAEATPEPTLEPTPAPTQEIETPEG